MTLGQNPGRARVELASAGPGPCDAVVTGWTQPSRCAARPGLDQALSSGVEPTCARNGSRPSRLRIAQVAPLVETVPPARYGGTEQVIATLTQELVRRGHQVTLFASGDSRTSARLVPIAERAAWLEVPPYSNYAPFVDLT